MRTLQPQRAVSQGLFPQDRKPAWVIDVLPVVCFYQIIVPLFLGEGKQINKQIESFIFGVKHNDAVICGSNVEIVFASVLR